MCLNVGDRKAGRAKVDQRGDIVEPVGPEGSRKRSRHELAAVERFQADPSGLIGQTALSLAGRPAAQRSADESLHVLLQLGMIRLADIHHVARLVIGDGHVAAQGLWEPHLGH